MEKLHVLVCVTGQKTCERLIVEGDRQARELDATLSVVHVARPGADFLGNPVEGEALEYLFQISAAHGADMTVIRNEDVVGTLVAQAKKMDANMLVLGVPGRGDWDITRELKQRLPSVELHVVYT